MKRHVCLLACPILLLGRGVLWAQEQPKAPAAAPENWREYQEMVVKLLRKLPQQTGYTDGYGRKYNIHEHEPAKSIIALGPRCIPILLCWIHSPTPTRARWVGRSSVYTLRVSDVVVCILRHIGAQNELALLKRRQAWLRRIWHDAREYKENQEGWSPEEKRAYMARFQDCLPAAAITSWTISVIEERLKEGNPEGQGK